MESGEGISFLIEKGMSIEEITQYLDDGISLTELVEASRRCIENGEPISTYKQEALPKDILSYFRPLSDFTEEEATWLIPGWIPEGQITLLAADGGTGKTTLWVHIVAAISNGTRCILDPIGHKREPKKVLFMTTEDSIKKKLMKKLRLAGANMNNIISPDFTSDRGGVLRNVKFGTKDMDLVLRGVGSHLSVFDPVQGFVPPEINMGSRNAMRDCMAPLITVGEDIAMTSIVVCHTNKRKGASGRDRIADSADLWDIARSVIMMGFTEDSGVRYLSNEKNNYDMLQETILFTINKDGQIEKTGTSWKRDREYQQAHAISTSKPKMDDCKEWILEELTIAGGKVKTKELDEKAKAAGYSEKTYKTAKQEMRSSMQLDFVSEGSAKKGDRVWHTVLLKNPAEDMEILPLDMATPFD